MSSAAARRTRPAFLGKPNDLLQDEVERGGIALQRIAQESEGELFAVRLGFLEVLDIGVEVDGDHVKDLPLRFLDDVFGLADVGVDVLVFPLLNHAGGLLGIPLEKMAAHLVLGDVEQLPSDR